jgi:hypothetical protein
MASDPAPAASLPPTIVCIGMAGKLPLTISMDIPFLTIA